MGQLTLSVGKKTETSLELCVLVYFVVTTERAS